VDTNMGSPSPSTATSCTSMSPVVYAICGTYQRSCASLRWPGGSAFSKRHSCHSVATHRVSPCAASPITRASVRLNNASWPLSLRPTKNSLPAW